MAVQLLSLFHVSTDFNWAQTSISWTWASLNCLLSIDGHFVNHVNRKSTSVRLQYRSNEFNESLVNCYQYFLLVSILIAVELPFLNFSFNSFQGEVMSRTKVIALSERQWKYENNSFVVKLFIASRPHELNSQFKIEISLNIFKVWVLKCLKIMTEIACIIIL